MHMYEGSAVNVAEAVPGHRGSVPCLRTTTHVSSGGAAVYYGPQKEAGAR